MTMQTDASSKDEAIVVFTRTFNAPRNVVWDVLTDPKHVVNWYGGVGFSSPVCKMDVRPGGRWSHVMRTPDGSEFPLEFIFVEVEKPKRLVWKDAGYDEAPKPHAPTRMMTATLEEDGKRTKWTLVARFHTIEERDETMKRGFANVLGEGCDKLDEIAMKVAENAA